MFLRGFTISRLAVDIRRPHTPIIKRRYLIPSAVALIAHMLFLFGFSRPVVSDVHGPITILPGDEPVKDPPMEIIRIEPADEFSEIVPDEMTRDPVPAAPEPFPTPVPDRPTMKLPPIRPIDVGAVATERISPNWTAGGVGDAVDFISADMLDNPPRARFQAAPAYPFSARQTGLGAEVVVEFIVNERGEVILPRVVRSTDPQFNEATLRAVAKWRFEPGRKNGRPVRFQMSVPVRFNVVE